MNHEYMPSIIYQLKTYWISTGVRFRPPASPDSVQAFELRYGVVLPEEVRSYFFTFDGLEDEEWDNDLISFWPLQRIGSVPEILGSHGGVPDYRGIAQNLPEPDCYFVFADYSCFAHVYAFKLTSNPKERSPVFWIGNSRTFCRLTNSFMDFLKQYLISPGDLNNAVLVLPDSPPPLT